MFDACRTEVLAGADGPVLVKTATSDGTRTDLAREAGRLTRVRHPGVVELLHAEPGRLELAWAGAETLEIARLGFPAAAAVLASVAATVADLHAVGLVHGRLDPSHVVLGQDGRPRLCGMRGTRAGEPVPEPADDVLGLGRLIDHLLGPGAEAEPIPDRRWSRRRWSGYQRRALQTLADQATDQDPDRRPSARALAAAIAQAVPDARLPLPPPGHRTGTGTQGPPPDPAVSADPSDVDPGSGEPSREAMRAVHPAPAMQPSTIDPAAALQPLDHAPPDDDLRVGRAGAAPWPWPWSTAPSEARTGTPRAIGPGPGVEAGPDDVAGGVEGHVEGDVDGHVELGVESDVDGDVGGDVDGDVEGDVELDVAGDVEVDLHPDPDRGQTHVPLDGPTTFLGLRIEPRGAHRFDDAGRARPRRGPATSPPHRDHGRDPRTGRHGARTAALGVLGVVLLLVLVGSAGRLRPRSGEAAGSPTGSGIGTPSPIATPTTASAAATAAPATATTGGSSRPGGQAPGTGPAPLATTTTTTAATATPAEPDRPAGEPRCPAAVAPAADLDGDGCVGTVTVDGSTVRAEGLAFRVGEPSDRIAVGDWDCDGTPTPGLVRPATGEVFLFDTWAGRDRAVTVHAEAVLEGVVALVVGDGRPCGPPSVRLRDGRTVGLPSTSGAPLTTPFGSDSGTRRAGQP